VKYLNKLFFVFFLLPLFSSAQTNYKPGYVVTNKGDTLKGFIDYREWDKNPVEITFKNNLNSQAEIFTTTNAIEFGLSGLEYFKQFNVHISQDQVELSNVKQGIDTSYLTGSVFLRTLTSGKNISLFSYTDNIKTRYYIQEGKEKQIMELGYHVFYSPENSTLLQTNYRFRPQLDYLAKKYNAENNKLETQISTSGYLEADLVNIVQVINGEINTQFTPKSRLGTRWYAGFGVTDNNLSFVGVIQYANNSSVFPKISGGFDLLPNKNTQQFFFRAELSFTENQHSFSYGPDAIGYSSNLSRVIQQNIIISPQLVYNIYSTDRFKLFIDAGVSINLSFYNSYQFTETVDGLPITTKEFPVLPQKWLSFPLKAGASFNKKVEVYLGYTPTTSLIDNYQPFTGKVYEYQAGINYLFDVK